MTDLTTQQPANLVDECFQAPTPDKVFAAAVSDHKPRILLLYGSLRERSFSRLVVEESARILEKMGAETRIFNPSGLPLPDDADTEHKRSRNYAIWCSGVKAWCGVRRNVMVP